MQRFLNSAALSCLLLVGGWATSLAGISTHEGTDFWLCFQKNYRESPPPPEGGTADPLFLELCITAQQGSDVSIDLDAIAFHTTLHIDAGTRRSVFFPEKASVALAGMAKKAAIHVRANHPISIVGLNSRFQTTDSYAAYPLSALGKQYRVAGYTKLSDDLVSQAAVVATEDNTTVTITPSEAANSKSPHPPQKIMLSKGDVYQVFADAHDDAYSDISGTLISADKNIAVFSGHNCSYVPASVQACNHLVEQLLPIENWGKGFYVQQLPERTHYSLRLVAAEESTTVTMMSGETDRIINLQHAGDYTDLTSQRGNFYLKSDKPFMLLQYSHGFRDGDSVGDPSMMLIRPVEQYLTHYTVVVPYFSVNNSALPPTFASAEAESATEVKNGWVHTLMIVIPPEGLASLRINGNPVAATNFHSIAGNMMVGSIELSTPVAQLECKKPFGITQYGFGIKSRSFDAYGHGW